MSKGRHILLWMGLGVFSALAGMMVHELGHVGMARVMGLEIAEVVWGPIGTGELSHTFLMDAPRPAMVVWSGFAMGCGLPVFLWGLAEWVRWRWGYLLRFFAGFCLVGNGAYLAAGWVESAADGGELARAGVLAWVMVMAGMMLVAGGLGVWHGLSGKMERAGWWEVIGVWGATIALGAVQWGLNG